MSHDAHHKNPDLQKRLEAIFRLNPAKSVFRLDKGPYVDLLAALDNPHLHLPPVIHIAGTNGKGSTLAFLKSLYEAAGLSVHAYTSPHLLSFNERITLNGQPINDTRLDAYLTIVETANAGNAVTFFEYTTAMAFKVMADTPSDIVLLETGLGGRLDCTNVVPNPVATVITAIGYDHMDWLGGNIETIAWEKAGIMKPGVPCVIAPQAHEKVYPVFEKHAAEVGCDVHFVKRWEDLPPLGLLGDHQKDNASTALDTFDITVKQFNGDIAQALQNTYWPARMEKVSDDPEIWFDCGHNADGAKVIAAQLKQWKAEQPDRPIHIIVGLAGDKNAVDFITPLKPYCDTVTCVDLPNARNPSTGEAIVVTLAGLNIPNLSAARDIKSALRNAPFKDNHLTLICGSLYLYGEVRGLY